ncbi:tRNA (adenosine(37)-N6)-threonylcarbamoyltransferase complex dimerization subunit type 1 TsaB [Methylosoma difficile]
MKLLAVETATEACSAALLINGDIRERFAIAPQQHTKLILPMLDDLLAEAGLKPQDLDALAFGCGPGSFTGVRIATGIIQGIAFGADLPVVPVSTLAALAQDFFDQHSGDTAFVAMDARMAEIFWGVYQRNRDGYAQLLGQEAVTPASEIDIPAFSGIGVGSGWGVYADVLLAKLAGRASHYHADPLPRAAAIAKLGAYGFEQGKAVGVDEAMPSYLRDKVAKKESER